MATKQHEVPEVLVVGAGPVGLSMACELARHGVPCRIVDANAGPTDQSRALGIQARTLEVFEHVGVIDPVLAEARKVHGVSAFSDAHRILHITFDLDAMETPYPHMLVLPQSRTEHILLDRLKAHGLEVERQQALQKLEQDGSGVSATLLGPDGQTSEVRVPWLVGCDGARSVVRKALHLEFDGVEYEESFLLADVKLEWDRPDDEMTIVLAPDGPFVGFPLPEQGRYRLVHASTTEVTPADAEPSKVVAMFQAKLREHGRPEAVVSDPTWTSSFKIHRRLVDRFREGRCFVAGDAAHIHSPAGGQGMNTGIQDAFNLAWKLALVIDGSSPDALLDSYGLERRSVVAGVEKGSDLLTRAVTLRNPVAKAIRNSLIGLLGEFDFVVRNVSRTMSELGVEYKRSPIVDQDWAGDLSSRLAGFDHFHAGPLPGERVPDHALEPSGESAGPRRLFEVLRGTKHVLFLFEGAREVEDPAPFEAVRDLVAKHAEFIETYLVVRGDVAPSWIAWEGPTIRDHEGHLHQRYGAHSPCLYLVRPDGYLGYRAMPPDAGKLAAYLGQIFLPQRASI